MECHCNAFSYLFNATLKIGWSAEVPGSAVSALNQGYNWLTGSDAIFANGIGFGIVVQFPGVSDIMAGRTIPYDVGIYGELPVPGGSMERIEQGINFSSSPEIGIGTGTIKEDFSGMSVNANINTPWGGFSTTFSGGDKFTGLSYRPFGGLGASINSTITGTLTVRDLLSK